MAIALVKKNGAYYEVIDENGYVVFSWVKDGLHGYTSSTVTFKNGAYLETYNAEGELINSVLE